MQPLNPATVSPLLLQTLKQGLGRDGPSAPGLAQAVSELSRLFTKDRAALNQSYLEHPALAAAYLHYFLPVNLSKIQVLLDEMPGPEARDGFKVLDVGAGPGTGGLAVLDWWHRRTTATEGRVSVVAVDHAQAALRLARQLWDWYSRAAGIEHAALQTVEGDLSRLANRAWCELAGQKAPFDLIILANCLNELHAGDSDPIAARTCLVMELLTLLAPGGTLMIVEPALRETSRALHQVRDRVLQTGGCNVYSPCLHDHPCPALVNPHDWCHEERAWLAPASIQDIDDRVGFIKDALKFSYVLLRTDGKTIVRRGPEMFRIVSELRELKGDTRAWVCNESGRSEVGRLDRALSETNAAWDGCQRGTIVRIEGLKRKEGRMLGRLPAEGTVKIARPA
jgi:ribosomal protein RSM22 (predicted rRNA methylase)